MADPVSTRPDRAGVLAEIDRVLRVELEAARPVRADEEIAGRGEMDSLGMIVLAVALEDRFRIALRERDLAGVVTFDDLIDVVLHLACAPAAAAPAAETPP